MKEPYSSVWHWYTYTNASISSPPYQITEYPSYVAKAISDNSLLLYCGLSFAELAHQIEKTEREIITDDGEPVRSCRPASESNWRTQRVIM